MAFATAFTIGPAIGAYFASFDLSRLSPSLLQYGVYPFSSPALVAFVLLIVEFAYIAAYVPETYNFQRQNPTKAANHSKKFETSSQLSNRAKNLKTLNWIHAIHLLIFSGMEFTLVFLTFDIFDYTHMQQGKLLGFIGIMSSLIQGGYVRRKAHEIGEKQIVLQGVQACACGLVLFTIVAYIQKGVSLLYIGAFLFAITSGTVVNCLTSLASMQCTEENPRLAKGRALGVFRSYGQLGRAIGPLAACGTYWAYGPVACYGIGSVSMIFVTIAIMVFIPQPQKHEKVI
jgi:MFS family permease